MSTPTVDTFISAFYVFLQSVWSFNGATENAGLENVAPEENAGVAQYGKPKSPLFNIVTSVLQQPLELM